MRIATVGIAIAAAIGHAGAQAPPHDPAPDAAPALPPGVACETAGDPALRAAVAEAERILHTLWLKAGADLFVAYATPPEKRNPFDLSPRLPLPDGGAGIIQARAPRCILHVQDADKGYVVRFTTPLYRFHEQEAGWSRPLRDGLVMEVAVRRADAGWQARDTKAAAGILEPEETARRPAAGELPRLTRWAEPVPGCARRERWTGEACVRRRR